MKAKLYYLATKLIVAIVFIAILVVKAHTAEAPKLIMEPHSDEKVIAAVNNNDDLNTYIFTIER